MKEKLVIIGAGGHGKVAANIARLIGYEKIVFLDDDPSVHSCGEYPVVGDSAAALNYNCDVFVAIGNAEIRQTIQKKIEDAGLNVPTLIHPSAVIAQNAIIGRGTVIMAGAVINADSVIGKGCIINTCASVDHDCRLSDYVHISVGAHLSGAVNVGFRTWIGIGTVVSNNLIITSDCMVGAGAVVIKSIYESGTYVGVPAKKIK